jgi:hypothetical protein
VFQGLSAGNSRKVMATLAPRGWALAPPGTVVEGESVVEVEVGGGVLVVVVDCGAVVPVVPPVVVVVTPKVVVVVEAVGFTSVMRAASI